MADPKKKLCRIMIMFAYTDDNEALAVKNAADKSVENNPDATVQCTFLTVPAKPDIRQTRPRIKNP